MKVISSTKKSAKAVSDLPTVGLERIPPDPQGTALAFRRVGYALDEALADLIDNSIDADAKSILIRFHRTSGGLTRIAVVDDGHGMSKSELKRAMQYGARIRHKKSDLGKYGIGLKTASFSQCQRVSIVTRQRKKASARRWTLESISKDWSCEVIDPKKATQLLDKEWHGLSLRDHGTIVVCDELDNIRISRGGIEKTLSRYFRSIPISLGIRFHRFLSSGQLSITLDTVNIETGDGGVPVRVSPLNPFGYTRSGHARFPKKYPVKMPGIGSLWLAAHIWPAKSSQAEYKLGTGQVAARQGFYFYRNDRIIQAGGWNGLQDNDSEPHLSLARVSIELPPALDNVFGLNVTKTKIVVPPAFLTAVENSSSDGITFRDYRSKANEAYRQGLDHAKSRLVSVPGLGIPSRAREKMKRLLAGKDTEVLEVSFAWRKLPWNRVFELDLENNLISLNKRYRKTITGGERFTAADAPITKTLMFLLLSGQFDRVRISSKQQKWLGICNQSLLAAMRAMK